MILMSKYKGQHGGKKGQKIRARPSPPLFGQCPKEIDLFYVRSSLIVVVVSLAIIIIVLRMIIDMLTNGGQERKNQNHHQ